ncbi:L,D-transpeptidase family protein [Acuticoccus mangrovi]|uniref:L,D-transpeptidase family protein n=1 Tax=Acuticoccus mangrovi TaxID=2796142 RepID=A0A934IRB1_9HYPH|nr:L,D-transpeptidase family protein [Acuticoccus mangrovi]MBJ3776827.1 L,D-transpeptidase family protein [Acuticoccus mangrovi]
MTQMQSSCTRALMAWATLAGAVALAPPARAEVPVPRLAPTSMVAVASHSAVAATAPLDVGPELPLPRAIEREVAVDVSNAVAAFYAAHDFAPIWTEERAAALRARLAAAAGDGLVPADYYVPRATPGVLSQAAEEVSLSEAALRYANDAHSGRVDPAKISRIMKMTPPRLDGERFLERLSQVADIGAVLESVHPQHPQYQALRAKLRAIVDTGHEAPPAVGKGPNLKLGVSEPRVAVLRSRLGVTVMRGTDPTMFDVGLDVAVKDFQRANRLAADGIVGPRTIALLDEGIEDEPTAALISNMERWRWMPRDLGEHYVFVNVPSYRVQVITDGKVVYDGRVIVGAPGNPTPIFSDEIEHIVVNPYWNVPFSIASNEMLGAIAANPSGYFARRGYEAVVNGRVVNPASIAWNKDALRRVRIRQKPGRGNALGDVKFLFPNEFAVYLHDTSSPSLFGRSTRALSHGCVRVDQPFAFADALLSENPDLSGSRIKRMVGGNQKWLNVSRHIPVHLAYFTRTVDATGRIERFADIYGFDARTQRALGL